MTTPFPEWLEPMAATLTAGPFHRPGVDLRAQVRRHPPDRIQERLRRPAVLAQPAAAERFAPRSGAGDREPAGPRRDPRRRSDLGMGYVRQSRLLRLRHPVARRTGRHRLAARRAPRAPERLPLRLPLEQVAALDDPKPWERACAEGWEGVIAKRRDSTYEHRRSKQWLKMKCEETHAFVVGGFTDPQGKRVGLGALLVGYFARRGLLLCREDWHRLRQRAAARAARAAGRASRFRRRRSRRRRDCRACARTGCVRRLSSRPASSNGPVTGSCVIRGCSACATTRRARSVVRRDASAVRGR